MIENDVIDLLRRVRPLGPRPAQIVPVSDEQLLSFEQVHGLALPHELKGWFKHCNGATVNPGGLYSLFASGQEASLDWYLKNYPNWKANKWFPVASDGCGDLYIVTAQITIASTGTHPVCFLDQSDFTKPRYVVASGLWRFLYLLLQTEVLRDQGKQTYWPFSKAEVIAADPAIAECRDIPLPWEIDDE